MIYLNNAGTSWPKPSSVQQAMNDFQELSPEKWNERMDKDLKTVNAFFNIQTPERLLMTPGCSTSLALAMTDFDWKTGDRLLMSSMEHHALSRWFHKLQLENGVESIKIPRASDGPIDLNVLETELKKGAKMVATSMAANVTGEILPYQSVISLARQYGVTCLLDGAQAAGILPIDISALDPDIFVFAGHKGPLGPKGIGGLYVSPNVPMICPSAQCNIDFSQPQENLMPNYCDSGSLNGLNLAGLAAGIEWIQDAGWETIINKRHALVGQMLDGLRSMEHVNILGYGGPVERTGAIAITVNNHDTNEVAQLLEHEHGIIVGSGFQCAPHAHEAVGTSEIGCLRLSVGVFSEVGDVEGVLGSIKQII